MMLKDKILEAAHAAIEQQEGVPAKCVRWHLFSVRHHQIIAWVVITTTDGSFEVWVVADLDTEEVTDTVSFRR